jgi:sulfur carrier protein ThiS
MHGTSNTGAGVRNIPDGASVADMLTALNLPQEDTYAVLVNDLPVSIEDRPHTHLCDDDKFTVFPPIKGG